MTDSYGVIVVGLGGIGSAALYHLARRGGSVLGLDMFPPGHSLGSSHGEHRIIREAYFEAPEYVPLVQRAYDLWAELEEESGDEELLVTTGGLMFGPPESPVVTGAIRSAKIHGLSYERLSAGQVAERFPGFDLPDDMLGVYEPRAGFVRPERAIEAHQQLAKRHGAEMRFAEEVVAWGVEGDSVRVRTTTETYLARRLVVTTGPWAAELLADLNLPLEVWRIVNAHFESSEPETFAAGRCPIYLFDVPEGTYYGFPYISGIGLKIGRHDIGEVTTARTIRREIDPEEIDQLRRVLDRYLPGASGEVTRTLTCMYTMTPDEHFIIDCHPDHPQVVIGCGFSGHGYKFASAIGDVLAQLAMDGKTEQDVGFLSLERFPS